MSKSVRFALALGLGIVFVLTVSVFAFAGDSTGSAVYQQYCAGCHGANGQGTQYGPSIYGESSREIMSVTRSGEDGMPRFGSSVISSADLQALGSYTSGLQRPSGGTQYHRDDDHDDDHNAGGSQYGGGRRSSHRDD